MLLIALLILPSLAFAAPVPEKPEKSDVELKLFAPNRNVLEITIQNNGKEPLELAADAQSYRDDLIRVFVDVADEPESRQFFVEFKGAVSCETQTIRGQWMTTYLIEVL